jgi:RHS repeat-associated protein
MFSIRYIAVALMLTLASTTDAQEWFELGDAGALPNEAQTVHGSGPLLAIHGQTDPEDAIDLYQILIQNPDTFSAATTLEFGGGSDFNTHLWLFDESGFGVAANDDCPFAPGTGSCLSNIGPSGQGLLNAPGIYYLAVGGFQSEALSDGGPIFQLAFPQEISGPDGPGGGLALSNWNFQRVPGTYFVSLSGTSFIDGGGCIENCRSQESPPERSPAEPYPGDCDFGGCPLPDDKKKEKWEYELTDGGAYPFSGDAAASAEDMWIPGRELDFLWSRKWRSSLGETTELGNNWDFAFNVRLLTDGANMVVADGNSRRDSYHPQPDGTWAADEFFRVLEQNPDGTLTLTFADQGFWQFHALDGSPSQGRLLVSGSRNGNLHLLEYNAGSGQLTTITDSLNRTISVTHNAEGLIDTVTDFAGRTVVYDYYEDGDAAGNAGDLKSVTTPAVISTPEFPIPPGHEYPAGKTTTYTYTTGFSDEALNGDLLTMTDPKGQTYHQFVYAHTIDPSDIRFTTDGSDIHFDRVVREIIGNAGEIIDFFYNEIPPTPENNFATTQTIINDRVGNVEETFYDENNRLVIRREYTGRANPDEVTTDVLNRPGPSLRPGDPLFFETRYEYNDDALVTRIDHPNGNVVLQTWQRDVDPFVVRTSYGNLLERRRQPGALGGDQPELVETYEYDADFGCGGCGSNFVTRYVDSRGHETLHEYDAVGNRTHTQHRIPSIVEDFEYNGFGQITAHVHPDNGSGHRRRDEFTYYDAGPQRGYRHEEIVDAGGFDLTTTYEYDLIGSVTRMVDARNHDSIYVVNQRHQIIQESSSIILAPAERYEILLSYDPNDNVVRRDVENVDENGVLQPNTHFTTITEYEILNECIRECTEVGSHTGPIPGSLVEPTCIGLPEEEFITTEYEYDGNRNRTLIRYGEAADGRQPNNTLTTEYDERDLVFRTIRGAGDADQSTTQFDYDGNMNQSRIVEGVEDTPRITIKGYDGYDRLFSSTDPMGNAWTFHYDGTNNRVSERLDGETTDIPGDAGNIRLTETTYAYDAMNRLTLKGMSFFNTTTQAPIDDGTSTIITTYSDNSQVLSIENDNGHVTSTTYDTANRPLVVTDAKGNSMTFAYDANSNPISVLETELSDLGGLAQEFTTTYEYDPLNRMTRQIDNVGKTNDYGYDSRSNRVIVTDSLRLAPAGDGNVTRYAYDGINRLTSETKVLTDDGTGAGSEIGSIITLKTWDDSSRCTSRIDDNGHTTTYEYDSLNRMTRQVIGDGTESTCGFDVHDNRTTRTDANGSAQTMVFDLLNRMISRTITPGPGVSSDTTFEVYGYDGLDRLTYAEDDDSIVTSEYDSLSNSLRETLNGEIVDSTHDGVGNKLTCTYPGGRVVTRSYDELERVKTISDAFGEIAAYEYVGPKRVQQRRYGNNTQTDYFYDGITGVPNPSGDFGVRRIVRTMHTFDAAGIGKVFDNRSYTWDRMHNKTSRSDESSGGLSHTYTYDSIYRMTRSVNSAGLDTPYSFDGAGNRQDGYSMYSGGATDDASVNQYSGTPDDRREYDNNGNLIRISGFADADADGDVDLVDFGSMQLCFSGTAPVVTASCLRFDSDFDGDVDLVDFASLQLNFTGPNSDGPSAIIEYDYRNQMVVYTDAGQGVQHEYAYDALGRRIRKIEDADGSADETRYLYDTRTIVEELDGDGNTSATYVYGRYIDEVVNMVRFGGGGETDGEAVWYHTDDLYNVLAVTDENGSVIERYDYDDYGRVTVRSQTTSPDGVTALISDMDPGVGGQQLVADDFEFTSDAVVSELKWWGAYGFGPTAVDNFIFNVYEHDEVSGGPGALIFSTTPLGGVLRELTGETLDVGLPAYIYRATLLDSFEAEAGQRYWLSIANNTVGAAASWGWSSSINGNGRLYVSSDVGGLWEEDDASETDAAFEMIVQCSDVGNPYLFTGRRLDAETGLYHYRTRYYDPGTGRFTSRDTIGIWGDEMNVGNGYTYVGNNPWTYMDPTGEGWFSALVSVVATAVAVVAVAVVVAAGSVAAAPVAVAVAATAAVVAVVAGAHSVVVEPASSALTYGTASVTTGTAAGAALKTGNIPAVAVLGTLSVIYTGMTALTTWCDAMDTIEDVSDNDTINERQRLLEELGGK